MLSRIFQRVFKAILMHTLAPLCACRPIIWRAFLLVRPDVSIVDLMKRAGPPFSNATKTTFASNTISANDDQQVNAVMNQNSAAYQCPNFGSSPGSGRPFHDKMVHHNVQQFDDASTFRRSGHPSPIRVYAEDECKVRNSIGIVPFSRESVQDRIEHLEATAAITLPRATDIAKLLKSHNIAMTTDEDHLVWYQHFGEFASMIGIYICPPNAMEKDSEMGKEWDSNSLPLAFHEKLVQSERILSHILRSPKFILEKYKDDLLLNP